MRRPGFSATAGSERPRRLTLVGLVAVPLLIGGILAWALAMPVANLDRVTAAIVNNDVPVTVNGQSVPLGRQFAAGLMAGSDEESDAAAAGSADQTTVPDPTVPGSEPTFDWVLTNSDEAAAGLSSGRYSAVVTIPPTFSTDATSIGGPAVDARQASVEIQTTVASAWMDPALTTAVTAGAVDVLNTQLISRYLTQVYDGFNSINTGIAQASAGADQLAAGAASAADGADQLSSGAASLAEGLVTLDAGASSLVGGTAELDAASAGLPGQTAELAAGAAAVSGAVGAASSGLDAATVSFAATVAELCVTFGPVCDRATAALAQLQTADAGVDALAAGASQVAAGNAALAQAMPGLVAAIDATANGAAGVAAGATTASEGAASLAGGASQLASGTAQLDDGAAQLASGLDQSVAQIPTYSDSDIATLSAVVSRPVGVSQDPSAPGLQSIPLFTIIALWLGALVVVLAVQAVPTRRLLTNAGSGAIAVHAVALPCVLGSIQGLLVAAIVLGSVAVSPAQWAAFAGAAVVIGAVFALANQGLAAAFGGAGRLVSLAMALIALAVGLSSTVPPLLTTVSAGLPTHTASDLLLATLTGQTVGGLLALGGLLFIAIGGFALVLVGVVARRRATADG